MLTTALAYLPRIACTLRHATQTVQEAARAPLQPVPPAEGMKWGLMGLVGGGAVASVLFAATSGLAAFYARAVVVPPRTREESLEIIAVLEQAHRTVIVLPANDETTVRGTYSLWFDNGQGHARIGEILSYVPGEATVLRLVEHVDFGDLFTATKGRWAGYIHPNPHAAGLPYDDLYITTENGIAPAWHIPAPDLNTTDWAIVVHGRGATRAEGLRAVPVLRECGLNSLLVTYRNDPDGPAARDGRYGLGYTEWRDVEDALHHAVGRGAQRIVLFGWSMGGAIVMQAAWRSQFKDRIAGIILDAPAIDWVDVLEYQARINRLPTWVARLSLGFLTRKWARWFTGLDTPVNLKALDWVTRAEELEKPTLLIHSVDDTFVPYGPSQRLAQVRPDLVRFEKFDEARHTKEWNVDPERCEALVREWLAARGFAKARH